MTVFGSGSALGLVGVVIALSALFLAPQGDRSILLPLSLSGVEQTRFEQDRGLTKAMRRAGRSPYLGPRRARLRFSYATGGPISGPAAIDSHGRVHVASHDGFLYTLTADGALHHRSALGAPSWGGPHSGDSGDLMVGTDTGALFRARQGGQWRLLHRFNDPVDPAPTETADGSLLVASGSGLYALPLNGPVRRLVQTHGRITASPTVGPDGSIYVASQDHRVYALSAAGQVRFSVETPRDLESAPVFVADRVYVAGDGGHLFSLASDTGRMLFHVIVDGHVRAPLAVGDGVIWVHTMGPRPALLGLDPDTGRILGGHRFPFLDDRSEGSRSGPLVDREGNVFVGGPDDAIYGFSPEGRLRFRYPVGAAVHARPTLAPDGTLYVPCLDGRLYALHDQ